MNTQIVSHGAQINLKRALEFLDETQAMLSRVPEHQSLNDDVQSAYDTLILVSCALRSKNSVQPTTDAMAPL